MRFVRGERRWSTAEQHDIDLLPVITLPGAAVVLGRAALARLDVPDTEIDDIDARIRERDAQRLQLEIAGGMGAGKSLFSGRADEQAGTRKEPGEVRSE
ncbi:MAG TPA: hypothetical protein VLF18_02010 [Tahibacter sp.]|uniref:hypothetical protein n=1 Tax=Tahibacter sp. TaxID=2056211 RepID=UPI002CAAE267|nr:hypothetical protein [Tahibacter sp.]HSX58951.1 hypothetical protein [Tahibacter sp.]